MQTTTLSEIKTRALEFHKSGQKWHFHILTPSCSLNDKNRYAFILENTGQNPALVYFSDQAEKGLGQELSPLLHGIKLEGHEEKTLDYQPSVAMRNIINRAKELNLKAVEWHHHVLFPGCMFNKHTPKYTFIFEDSLASGTLESLSDNEPTNDLKQIEPLFYKM